VDECQETESNKNVKALEKEEHKLTPEIPISNTCKREKPHSEKVIS